MSLLKRDSAEFTEPSGPVRVLLIEDNRSDYLFTRALLESLGGRRYLLDWADSYAAGKAALARDAHDICLLDYQLDGNDGLTLMREAIAAGCRKPMIVVTAHGSRGIDLRAIEAGAADYIVKGRVDAAVLERAIRYALGRSHVLEALRQSEERYALAVRGANDAIWDWNALTGQLYLSPRWPAMIGAKVNGEELEFGTLETWAAYVAEEDRSRLREAFVAHLRGETPHFECEFQLLQANKRRVWVTARGIAVRDPLTGRAERVAGSLTDITERTLHHHQLRATFASMVEGVIAVDGRLRVLHLNEQAAAMLDTSVEAAAGLPIAESCALIEINRMLRRTVIEQREVRGEVRLPHSRPQPRVVALRSAPLRTEGDPYGGAVVVLHDITALRQLEQRQREFVASVSHELQTPLAAIVGMVDTLADDPKISPEKRDSYLSRIAGQCQRLSALVTDLLTLSRAEALERRYDQCPFDLRTTLREAKTRLEGQASLHNIRLEIEIPDHEVLLGRGEEQLQQVVDNLLTNAIKYSTSGGTISLSLETEGPYARLAVKDTGIGIAAEHQQRIFERFYRIDKARTRAAGGTGLGLAIVKNLVRALDGTVNVESTPGEGSTFTVRLPLAASVLARLNSGALNIGLGPSE